MNAGIELLMQLYKVCVPWGHMYHHLKTTVWSTHVHAQILTLQDYRNIH